MSRRPRVPAVRPLGPPLPPPPRATSGPLLPPTCGHQAPAGQRAGSSLHTHKSAPAPARAPRLLPPQRFSIRPSGHRILRSGRPAPAAAPAPPETKAQRVARSLRPAPELLTPPSLCSPGPRALRYSRGTGTQKLRGSKGSGGAGGAATAGRGRGRSWHLHPAPPPATQAPPPTRPPTSCPWAASES